MLKYYAISAAAIAAAFLLAGLLSNLPRLPFLREEEADGARNKERRYRFLLGCGLLLSAVVGVCSAACGYPAVSLITFAAAVAGAVLILDSFGIISRGGGVRRCCVEGKGETVDREGTETGAGEKTEEPKELIGNPEENIDAVVTDDYRRNDAKNYENNTTYNHIKHKITKIIAMLTQFPRGRAVACGVIFAAFIVFFSVFAVGVDGNGDDCANEIYESSVIFGTWETTENAIFLTAERGADVYAVFGYALRSGEIERLGEDIDGETAFTVRYTVMDEDEWSGYYRLLDIRGADGCVYLSETDVLSARAEALTGKRIIFGFLTLFCGAAFGFCTVSAMRGADKGRSLCDGSD